MSKTIEQNFADWEGSAFGLGYGTGEPHIIPALRKFLTFCTGNGGTSYNYADIEAALGGPTTWLLINALAGHHSDVIEYGTSPRFGWLTPQGQALQHFMLSRDDETLIRLACEHDDPCYPNACNCGPRGYEEGRVCVNPFWQKDAAFAYLKTVSSPPSEG